MGIARARRTGNGMVHDGRSNSWRQQAYVLKLFSSRQSSPVCKSISHLGKMLHGALLTCSRCENVDCEQFLLHIVRFLYSSSRERENKRAKVDTNFISFIIHFMKYFSRGKGLRSSFFDVSLFKINCIKYRILLRFFSKFLYQKWRTTCIFKPKKSIHFLESVLC